jgi:hypothetical protein
MRELINLAKQLKTPALTVYLNAPYNKVQYSMPSARKTKHPHKTKNKMP